VNIKIAGKWMFIPLKMVLIGIDPYPIQWNQNSVVPNSPMRCSPGENDHHNAEVHVKVQGHSSAELEGLIEFPSENRASC